MAPLALPLVKVTVVPEGALPVEPPVGVELELLPPPPLAEDELLLDEEEPPPPLELLELLLALEPPLLLLELLELPPPPLLELELLLEDEPPLLLELEELLLLEPPPPPDELLELLLLPPLPPVSLLAAGRQPVPTASNPAKHRPTKPVPALRRNRPIVAVFIMMPSLVPGGSRLKLTKAESSLLSSLDGRAEYRSFLSPDDFDSRASCDRTHVTGA